MAKAERNCLYLYPRTHAQYVSRVRLDPDLPVGQIAINTTQLRNFELTADGLERFPWSSFDVVESSDLKQLALAQESMRKEETKEGSEDDGGEDLSPPLVWIRGLHCVELELSPLFEGAEVKGEMEVEVDGKAVVKTLSTMLLRHVVTLHERIAVTVNGLRWLLRSDGVGM